MSTSDPNAVAQWRSSLPDANVRRVDPALLPLSASLVLVVATEVERSAMLRHLVAVDGKDGIPFASVGAQTYYFGRCGAHDVALLMCEMGSSKPGASTHAVRDAIERWKPRAVLMVGIAFGRPDKGLSIGDVLVAEQIAPYESQRVGSATVHRGPKPPASVTLVNRFRNVLDWTFPDTPKTPAVRICEVLSGDKLVDNPDFLARLFIDFPNARWRDGRYWLVRRS